MNKLNLSLFTRLYLSIFLVVSISIMFTAFLNEHWSQEDAKNDFLRDTQISFNQIKHLAKNSGLAIKDYIEAEQDNFHFDIYWQDRNNLLCIDCQLLLNLKNLKLYQLEDGEMLVQHYLSTDNGSVIIQDKSVALLPLEDDMDEETSDYSDPETLLPIFIIATALVAMALGLYYPIKQLDNKVKQLNQTQKAFGQGQLNVRANTELPSPLNELAHNFNHMANNIEQTLVENQIFAHAVPHELRTPLSRIQLAAGILASSEQTAENQSLLDNIDTYIEDINSLIKQLLTLSKLNQNLVHTDNHFHQQSTDEVNIANFIMERLSSLPLNTDVHLDCSIANTYMLICESSYLRLVLDNLITNAFRYCNTSVRISLTETENSYRITVEDDGEGINKSDYDKIFVPFSRLDKSRTKATGGLGLGLAIAQAATNKLTAKLTLEPSPLGGASFVFTIPASRD